MTLVEKGSPHSTCLQESGKILPGVRVVIANPESQGMLGDSHLGEVKTVGFLSVLDNSRGINPEVVGLIYRKDSRYLSVLEHSHVIDPVRVRLVYTQ